TATIDTTGTLHVEWMAIDPQSGVRDYDVEYKVDDGAWTGWYTDTGQTAGSLPGERGHVYGFRVRAIDRVSNEGAWAETSLKAIIVRKYYHLAGQRVAMRANGVVYWLHGDHLGSTSLTTDASGNVVAEQRYYPYGEVRWTNGTLPTDYTFTGQRDEFDLGLMDYRARFYSPRIGRFLSPDALVPDPTKSMEFNRYGYCLANP
ncbi:MAG: RHS repeat-associated core domain-containing protein, partial [Anaerolineae bacterium]